MKIPFGKRVAAMAVALASVTPAIAAADPGSGHGAGQGKVHRHSPATAPGKTRQHRVTYVFKGTWDAGSGTVMVKRGNAHVRKAGLVGEAVAFDLADARLVVADTDGDGSRTSADLTDGDRVVVKARLPRKDPGVPPFRAKMLIDQSAPPTHGGSGA